MVVVVVGVGDGDGDGVGVANTILFNVIVAITNIVIYLPPYSFLISLPPLPLSLLPSIPFPPSSLFLPLK